MQNVQLKLLPLNEYTGVDEKDPIKFYNLPVIGKMYRRRIELCLDELIGGEKILEIGFGSGVSFLNLNDMYKEIFGLDLSADVDVIKKKFAEKNIHLNLKNGNILSLPYPDNFFDSVLLISILEHLKKTEQDQAFDEIKRVLKPRGQVVYGVPIERPFMVMVFHILGTDIRSHHFSTEKDVYTAAYRHFIPIKIKKMTGPMRLFGDVYEIGHFEKR